MAVFDTEHFLLYMFVFVFFNQFYYEAEPPTGHKV